MTEYVEMKLGREKRSLLYFTVNDLFDVTSGGIRDWKMRRLQVENEIRDYCTHSSNSPSWSLPTGEHTSTPQERSTCENYMGVIVIRVRMLCRAGPHQ
jgi:hypothetical protein